MQPNSEPQKEVELILSLFDKAIRQFALYGKNHPQFGSFLTDLETRLQEFLKQGQSLTVEIKRNQMEWDGIAVFLLEKKENNYLQDMYTDGLRKLELLPSVSRQELLELLTVFARDVESFDNKEDDTVTLLWKKNLQSIRYETVDIYASDRLALIQHDVMDDSKQEKDFLDNFIYRIIEPSIGESASVGPIDSASSHHQQFAEDIQKPVPKSYIAPEEGVVQELVLEAQTLGKRDMDTEISTILAELLESGFSEEKFDRLLSSYISQLSRYLEEGDTKRASEWLRRLRGVQSHLSQKDPLHFETIERALTVLSNVEIYDRIGKKFAGGLSLHTEDWIQFFTYLGPSSVRAVCHFLSYIEQETIHNVFSDFLLAQGSQQTEVFLSFTKNKNPRVVKDMVRILGNTVNEGALPTIFTPLATHSDVGVRLEVVRAMRLFSGPFARDLIRRGFIDSDAQVRLLSLRMAYKSPDPTFAKALAHQITRPNFSSRDPEEKKLSLTVLARSGGASAFPFLLQILKSEEEGIEFDELRISALHAVRVIDDPKSNELLREYVDHGHGSDLLKDTARKLLDRKTNLSEDREEKDEPN